MNNIYDYKRFAILYVDDEEMSLKYFRRALEGTFRIFTATNATEGYRVLEDHQEEIGVIMTDQRMPGEQGVQFLERARRLRPQIIRILATAFADIDAAVSAVNTGAIYKYVTKPWDVPSLETTLKRSLEFFLVQMERDLLLREKLSMLHRMLVTDRVLSLGVLAAGLGHQLRHSVDAMRGFLDLASTQSGSAVDLNELRNPDFWQDFHRHVQSRIKQIVGLLDDLAWETGQPFKFDTEVHLRNAVDEAIAALAPDFATRRIQVANAIPAGLPPLRVDRSRFQKLFTLILRNELLNLGEGCVVRFEATHRPERDGQPEAVDVFVTDNGTGLPAGDILALLDPLAVKRGEAQNAGIYLMACYFIVFHHGGRIRVAQAGGGGMALTLTLPLHPQTKEAKDESEEFLIRTMSNERLWERLLAGI